MLNIFVKCVLHIAMHCAMCGPYCAMCPPHCAMCGPYCAMYPPHCAMCGPYCGVVCFVQCVVCTVFCAMLNQCSLCIVIVECVH